MEAQGKPLYNQLNPAQPCRRKISPNHKLMHNTANNPKSRKVCQKAGVDLGVRASTADINIRLRVQFQAHAQDCGTKFRR